MKILWYRSNRLNIQCDGIRNSNDMLRHSFQNLHGDQSDLVSENMLSFLILLSIVQSITRVTLSGKWDLWGSVLCGISGSQKSPQKIDEKKIFQLYLIWTRAINKFLLLQSQKIHQCALGLSENVKMKILKLVTFILL